MPTIPKQVFFVNGIGHAETELLSFENALRSAQIERFNLVRVSSILPPQCKVVSPSEGLHNLNSGQVVFCVMSRVASHIPCHLTASVGCAFPTHPLSNYGYISEHHNRGWLKDGKETTPKLAKFMADRMFSTYSGEKPIKVISHDAYHLKKDFCWTTVISVAVFVD